MFITDCTIASILPSMLCDWSIMNATAAAVAAVAGSAWASAISRMIRNSSNGSIAPTIRSSSAYLRLLKWKPPSSPSASRSATICSTFVPCAWWPVSTRTCAFGPSRRQIESRRAPVGQIRAVEGRLEELVLDEEAQPGRERRVELLEARGQACVAPPEVVLARVVRAVGEPEADRGRSDLAGDLDALEAVLERLPANRLVRVAQAAEAVGVIAEDVRVDRADAQTLLLGEAAKLAPVVDPIPGHMERDRGAAAGEPVDERRVGDPLPHVAGRARPGEDVEARPRVAVAPRGRLDLEPAEANEQRIAVQGRSMTYFGADYELTFETLRNANHGR